MEAAERDVVGPAERMSTGQYVGGEPASRGQGVEAMKDIVFGSVSSIHRLRFSLGEHQQSASLTFSGSDGRHHRQIHRVPLRHRQSAATVSAGPPSPTIQRAARLLSAVFSLRRAARSLSRS